ncbi:hypothetical protein BBP40_005971 [Aspergillus hancockii]|nr:hypothetical protein BBP40_005971 [Aspergillus hancockii]
MKLLTVIVIFLGAVSVNALSSCILNCQDYGSACSSDMPAFFANVNDFCNGDQDVVSYDSSVTIAGKSDNLGSCILNCQSEAGQAACSTSNYNETSCYCAISKFSKNVRACLSSECADYVNVFDDYRDGVCPALGSGLTPGQKAGISVGSIVGGSIVVGAAVFLVLRQRRITAAKKKDEEARLHTQMKESDMTTVSQSTLP